MRTLYRNKHIQIIVFVLATVLLLGFAGSKTARADGKLQAAETSGSLTLDLAYTDSGSVRKMEGGRISMFLVAKAIQENGDWKFDTSSGKFASSNVAAGIAMMDSEELTKRNAELSASLEKECATAVPDSTSAVSEGSARFTDLKAGLYFVRQEEESEGKWKISSFLITVPNAEGDMDVKASPKLGISKGVDDPSPKDPDPSPTGSDPKVTPSASPSASPSAPPTASPSASPTASPSASPTGTANPSPTLPNGAGGNSRGNSNTRGEHPQITSSTGKNYSNSNTANSTSPRSGSSSTEKLPQTGQLWWPVPLLTIIGLALILRSKTMKQKP